jgi:hypothetical protein
MEISSRMIFESHAVRAKYIASSWKLLIDKMYDDVGMDIA